ncbi:hypothetical protein ACT4R0_08790 [Ornithobacterium rhinotracheale]|uniref:hypothetical protein n=1 Tax=Ornithobacterium rhinotracheale TaxID=28251 RepID=UPI004035812F
MKLFLIFLLLLSIQICFSQEKITKVIVDYETKKPLSGVSIFNSTDYSMTNEDGRFFFHSNVDTVQINAPEYQEIITTFSDLQKIDTISLKKINDLNEVIHLDAVVATDSKKNLIEAYKNFFSKFSRTPYVEQFFLRSVVRKNGELMKMEDLSGAVKRNVAFPNKETTKLSFDFEIYNQRKFGVVDKSKEIEDFKFFKLEELFNMYLNNIFLKLKKFSYKENKRKDGSIKIEFSPLEEFKNYDIGYYLINDDHVVMEISKETNPELETNNIPFEKKAWIKFRTINSKIKMSFQKDEGVGKYFMSKVSVSQTLENYNSKTKEKNIYTTNYELIVTKPFSNIKDFKANIGGNKRIFEINKSFDRVFWENQNQLTLTDEMIDLIKNANRKKLEIESNF